MRVSLRLGVAFRWEIEMHPPLDLDLRSEISSLPSPFSLQSSPFDLHYQAIP